MCLDSFPPPCPPPPSLTVLSPLPPVSSSSNLGLIVFVIKHSCTDPSVNPLTSADYKGARGLFSHSDQSPPPHMVMLYRSSTTDNTYERSHFTSWCWSKAEANFSHLMLRVLLSLILRLSSVHPLGGGEESVLTYQHRHAIAPPPLLSHADPAFIITSAVEDVHLTPLCPSDRRQPAVPRTPPPRVRSNCASCETPSLGRRIPTSFEKTSLSKACVFFCVFFLHTEMNVCSLQRAHGWMFILHLLEAGVVLHRWIGSAPPVTRSLRLIT